ncbi:MAG: hypothetical protein K2Q18_10145 [Bdellovibrionales bacterium]|nr:hypothetical protein [Bdellovibrionales bacterium]
MESITSLVIETSLQPFFYDQLQVINRKTIYPLPNETIYYLSLVMDKLGDSSKYFEIVDGKVREKVLGIKLLEASHLPKEKKKTALRDVGETSLILCGYFSDSMNRKQISPKYYQDLGVIAYDQLNAFVPNAYDVPSFFKRLAKSFNHVTNLLTLVSKDLQSDKDAFLLVVNNRNIT